MPAVSTSSLADSLAATQLPSLRLDPRFTEELPGDPSQENMPRQVTGACYSQVLPQGFPQAKLLSYSSDLASTLGLRQEDCLSQGFVDLFSGTHLLPGMTPYAQCYGGHQFGHWAGQLGDGRAITLGTLIAPDEQRWELQLKGAGPTPYSRSADGYAVLRSSLREYLCSEAMFHLGIPTTRALSLIATGEDVLRDMFYDGRPAYEPGAVVCRVAPSFLRFGSYELFAARREYGQLKQLADFTLRHHFPHLLAAGRDPDKACYEAWFDEVCRRTCDLMVHWMRVGFVHGVMNTDNLSILGLTIDYGPYGWLDDYDPQWTPNTTDANGRRYRYGQQAQVALWNLAQLANALYPLINDSQALERSLEDYQQRYEQGYRRMMADKLGLDGCRDPEDAALIQALTSAMTMTETDMTLYFRALHAVTPEHAHAEAPALLNLLRPAFYEEEPGRQAEQAFVDWLRAYARRLSSNTLTEEQRQQCMQRNNPWFILRNYLVQVAIDKAVEGDLSDIELLLDALKRPYHAQTDREHLAARRPDWARHRAGCSMLSCSS